MMGGRRSDAVQLASCWLILIVVGRSSSAAVTPPGGGRNREISVPRGLSTYIRSGDLGLDFRPDPVIAGVLCVISVLGDDPGSLRVGRVYPEVFPCDFPPDVVRYVHNGNPTLDVDRIRLVIRQATNSETYVDEVVLTVRITSPVGIVFVHKSSSVTLSHQSQCSYPPSELTVDSSKSSLSAPIDTQTLRFRYDFTNGAVCTLTYSDRQPSYFRSQSLNAGYLVSADGTPVVGNLSIDCRDFVTSGFRYRLRSFDADEMNSTAIDVDYIPLTAEVEDFAITIGNETGTSGIPTSGIPIGHTKVETLFLPVRISTGVRNKSPEIRTRRDLSSTVGGVPTVWIDQFSTLTLTADILSAVDDETPRDDLVFTVLRPPTHLNDGYLVDIRRDAWKPIRSFWQRDISEGRIAFQPASREPASDRTVDVDLIVTDGRFASSRSVRFRIGIRRVEPASPKITRNAGLVLGSGQSRRIGLDQLRIYDVSGRSDWIQIHILRAGPRHGTIKVRGRVADAFNVSDLERREVVYEHAGGSSESNVDDLKGETDEDDSIMLRISNFKYSTRTRFPIYIIRNSWRTGNQQRRKINGVGTNVATEVRQNGYAQITTLHLDFAGYDARSPGGATGETYVYEVVRSPQFGELLKMFRPMTRGRHTSHFTQQDLDRGHVWYRHTAGGDANKSIATSRDYFRFVLRPTASHTVSRKANDESVTAEEPEVVLQHDVVVRPHEIDLPPRPGRNSTRTLTMSTAANLVTIGRDSLSYVDGENPSDDVLYVVTCQPYIVRTAGVHNRDQLITDDAGQIVYFDKTLPAFTVRPQSPDGADNMTSAATIFPPLRTFTQSMIDADLVSYRLPATSAASCTDQRLPIRVRFSFSVSDLHGNFAVDQSFDIHLLPSVSSAFRISKLAPTIESAARRLPTVSSDENGAIDRSMPARVIDVNEGGQVIINASNVIDNTLEDQASTSTLFDIIKSPVDGVILINGRESKRFSMLDLRSGSVRYQHTGGETGQIRRTDSATFSVRSNGNDEISTDLIDLQLVIRPVDNSPPELTVGGLVVLRDDQLAVPLTAEAVSASDVDTDPDRLMFVVVETPTFGRLDISRTKAASGKVAAEARHEVGATVATRRGRSSNERRAGGRGGISSKRAVTAFSMSDLRSGAVRYVRRSNTSTLPDAVRTSSVFDSFKVYVSDGHRSSAVGQVEIALGRSQRLHPSLSPIADLPALKVEPSIDVEEGGDRVFEVSLTKDTASALGVESSPFDLSSTDPIVSLVSQPHYGNVILSIKTGTQTSEVDLDTVALSDLANPNVRLIYRHDGRPSLTDQFSLSLTDGYTRSSPQIVRVDVHRANRQTPMLVTISKLVVQRFVGMAYITPSHLTAEDLDSSVDQVRYFVVVPPTNGYLERLNNSSSVDVREQVRDGDSFSQAEIEAGRMRYVISGTLAATLKDSIVLRLTDGKNDLPSTITLDIELVDETSASSGLSSGKSAADNEYKRIVIVDGFGTSLTTNVLGLATDDVESPTKSDFRYRVTRPPRLGDICLQYNESVTVRPATVFTRLDIDDGRVFYRLLQESSLYDFADSSDLLEYQLENIDGDPLSTIRRLHIDIKHDDDLDSADEDALASPPTLTLDVNVPLTVIHGYRATLSSGNLHMSVSGRVSAASRLVYTVVEPPKHGQIVKTSAASERTSEGVMTFTQNDVDAGLIEYKSDSSDESMMDYFLFSIGSDSTSSRQSTADIASASVADQKPLFFSILIQPVTKIPPKVMRRQSPDRLERLDDASTGSGATTGSRFGFIFTDEHLKAVHPLFDARDVVYQLKTRPQYGYLEHIGSKRQIRRKFTQRDIDERRIVYVLNDRTRATNDSFTYRIVDLNRNAIDDQRMQMEWSIIQFSQSQYIVCEDAQQLAVSIVRTGSVNHSAAVTVRLKSLTAKESLDFKNKSSSTVEFPPGTKEVKWMVEIVNDGMHEGNDEKFKVLLENTNNAIMGQIDKTQVHLIDFEDGECMEYIGMITKHSVDQSSSAVVDIGGRLSKSNQRHRHVAFNKQTNAFRGLDDDWPDDELDPDEEYDGKDDVIDNGEYDDYHDKPDDDATSSLLSSDLAFYMPPESGSQTVGAGGASRKNNRKNEKSGALASSAKRSKSLSSENIKLAVPQPCSRETQGLLFFDLQSSKMYRCTGQRWEHWGWGLTGATEAPVVIPASSAKQSARRRKQTGSKSSTEMRGEVRTARHDIGGANRDVICPTNWTLDGSTCYQLIAERTTWNEAERRCQSLGGHVTAIRSWQDLGRLSRLAGQRQFWTGIYSEPGDDSGDDDIIMRPTTTSRVRWINADGTRPTYFNWRSQAGNHNDPSTVACSATGDCDTVDGSVNGPGCVAVIGARLQFVPRPCGGVHRLRAICSARPQQLALRTSLPSSSKSSVVRRRSRPSGRPAG